MTRLIAITGPSGAGKTTLLNTLASRGGFSIGHEEHVTRPFQTLFKSDPRYALPNQLDYLLARAEQERSLREGPLIGLIDGGLDQDLHGFTRLFHARGWLSDADLDLCRRFHQFARSLLPPPERVIVLHADPEAIRSRLAGRNRINIASEADAELLASFLDEWLNSLEPEKVLRLDVTRESQGYSESCRVVLDWLGAG